MGLSRANVELGPARCSCAAQRLLRVEWTSLSNQTGGKGVFRSRREEGCKIAGERDEKRRAQVASHASSLERHANASPSFLDVGPEELSLE